MGETENSLVPVHRVLEIVAVWQGVLGGKKLHKGLLTRKQRRTLVPHPQLWNDYTDSHKTHNTQPVLRLSYVELKIHFQTFSFI